MTRKLFAVLVSVLLVVSIFPQRSFAASERPYIVLFEEVIDEQLIVESGATVVNQLKNSPIAMVRADERAFRKLQQAQSIQSIEADVSLEITAQKVDWGIAPSRVDLAWRSGYKGHDVKIAIIDTGIGPHDDLNVVGGKSFVPNETTYTDRNGHGTHIAGIIGALDNQFGVKGIAPHADLYALKVFDKNGQGFTSNVIKAIDWAIENDMDIVNLSLSAKTGSEAYYHIVNRAYAKGILLVAAAGNETVTGTNIDTVEFPAKYNSVIAVSSVDENNRRGFYSAVGPAVEIAAPGEHVYSTYLDNTYDSLSGTSLATAYISGQLALLKEAYPLLNNVQLRKKMVDTALDLGPKGRDPIYGYGLMQTSSYETPLYEYPAKNNPVVNLTFSEKQVSGEAGNTVGIKLTAKYKNGLTQGVSDFAKWTSEMRDVATSRGGRIDLHKAGKTTLRATYGGLTIELPVKVQAPANASPKNGLPFTDLEEAYWAYHEIHDIYNKLIITGYADGSFNPGEPIKRQHVASMIARTLHLPKKTAINPFEDVKMSSPYFYDIMKTQQARIFSGNQTGFRPNDNLTRAQMAKVVTEAFDLPKTKAHPFPDVSSDDWSNEYVGALYAAGITTGSNGKFNPNRYVTRAEFTVFIHRALNL